MLKPALKKCSLRALLIYASSTSGVGGKRTLGARRNACSVLRNQKCLDVGDFRPGQHIEYCDVREMRVTKLPGFLQGLIDRQSFLELNWS